MSEKVRLRKESKADWDRRNNAKRKVPESYEIAHEFNAWVRGKKQAGR